MYLSNVDITNALFNEFVLMLNLKFNVNSILSYNRYTTLLLLELKICTWVLLQALATDFCFS